MAKQRNRIFNFLNATSGPKNAWDKVYDWIINRARIVLLFVEALLVITFISKVFVDIQASTYDIQIKDQKRKYEVVNKFDFPPLNRIQLKAENYTKAWNGATSFTNLFNTLQTILSNPGQQAAIRAEDSELRITTSVTLQQAQVIEAELKSLDLISNVRVQVEGEINSDTGQVTLTIDATINPTAREKI